MEGSLQMFRAEVFPAYHTITQDAYGRPVALAGIAKPHWIVRRA